MSSAPSPDAARRARLKLLLLAAFFAAPLVFAWLAYRFEWGIGALGNYGELVGPAALPEVTLTALDGRQVSTSRLRGRWVLVQFDAARCDAYCERKLYYMRQVRRALGKDMERVARLWVLTDGGTPASSVAAAFEGTEILRSDDGSFAAVFGAASNLAEHIYLVDPMGNLMLRFPRDPDPSKMLKDLQRLLKYSQIG
ncbi:MAG TPA: SCO family protein [Burkholderiales bacterium]|nr:SCO family protein [Burkholderiales bacterium]